MKQTIVILLFLALGLPAGERIAARLDELHAEYLRIKDQPTIEQLVAYDAKLRDFIGRLSEYRSRRVNDEFVSDQAYWQDRYAEMGLFVQKFTEEFGYSGVHLVRAHKMDPHSPWRSHTLFAAILGEVPWHGLGMMPDISTALQYAREFPSGPFIAETQRIIANFYKDFYMVLRDPDSVSYKYDCFKPYISPRPLEKQRDEAQKRAIDHYRKYLALRPGDADAQRLLKEVTDGTVNEWSFCGD